MGKSGFRVAAAALAVTATATMLSPSVAEGAAAACPSPTVKNVPCTIVASNNTGTATLTTSPTRVVSATVAAGRYAVVATVVIFSNAGLGEPTPFAHCALKAGSTVLDQLDAFALDQGTTVTLIAARNLTASTTLRMMCADPIGFNALRADYARLQATRLGTLRLPPSGSSSTQGCPGPTAANIPCAVHVSTTTPVAVGASPTTAAGAHLAAGKYALVGRVALGRTSGSATVQCDSGNQAIRFSSGVQGIQSGKTAEFVVTTTFSTPAAFVSVDCSLTAGAQARVDSSRLTFVRLATTKGPATTAVSCPAPSLATVPCAIASTTNSAGTPMSGAHSTYGDLAVGPGKYAVSASVAISSSDAGFHFVDCALITGSGDFGAAFDDLNNGGDTLLMIDSHIATSSVHLTVTCADDSDSGALAVTEVRIVATRLGTLKTVTS